AKRLDLRAAQFFIRRTHSAHARYLTSFFSDASQSANLRTGASASSAWSCSTAHKAMKASISGLNVGIVGISSRYAMQAPIRKFSLLMSLAASRALGCLSACFKKFAGPLGHPLLFVLSRVIPIRDGSSSSSIVSKSERNPLSFKAFETSSDKVP